MAATTETDLIQSRYREAFGAQVSPSFTTFKRRGDGRHCTAALGYKRACEGPLFLESYLNEPVELAVSNAFGRPVSRGEIVEIGNFAADSGLAMVALWGVAANDLADGGEIAVATLTAPLRRMFVRIGVPVIELADARPAMLGAGAANWGRYYESDPRVCAGPIAEGQEAIAAFLARRKGQLAA